MFSHVLVWTSFSGRSAINTEERINLKIGGNFRHKSLKCFSNCMKLRSCHVYVFWRDIIGSKKGDKEVIYNSKSDRPLTSRTEFNVKCVRQVMWGNHWLTVLMIASRLGMKNCAWKIITEDLGIREVFDKMVPRLLNGDQKERCMQVW